MKLRCLIVDDEPLARKGLTEYIREIDFLQLAGECTNANKADQFLTAEPVDLLLMDIQMPHVTGIDFLKSLENPPMVIITTAYSEFAIEGYELDVIDFLVKPISFERFLKATTKALDFKLLKMQADKSQAPEFLFVKSKGKFEKIYFDEILYVESLQNYVVIHLPSAKHIVYMTLGGMEKQLPATSFIRVHKSFLVSIAKVNGVDGHDLLIGQSRVPVSRSLRADVLKRIFGDNLLER